MIINIGNEKHNDLCIGIDLGTTNSVLATVNLKSNGDIVSKVVRIPRTTDVFSAFMGKAKFDTQKGELLPSCVYYREEDKYEPMVGDFAKQLYPMRPQFVAKSIKSQMGKKYVEGLSKDIPDKTPAEVASNILRHLIANTEKIYKCQITDAVITVPANFDSVMCKATLDAAELAGIKVKNEDGTDRPVLLSEPNAVIYDLINQVRNGEISRDIIDLSEERNVIVFDLGGGTLDITMHKISRREDYPDILKVTEISTNRYTLLGGDDFDQLIADEMYKRYIDQYSSHSEIVAKIKKEKRAVMPLLLNYAERLKLELSERNSGINISDGWDDDDDEEDRQYDVGGSMRGIGYSYDDSFTRDEIENILKPYMGINLKLDDYKRIEEIRSEADTRNIIYPILDVLKKAEEKLGRGNVRVDEIIVNGGMSKFYMITDRLREFFGLEPIVALDPDQSVARGAAVYHYYLHKYYEINNPGPEAIPPTKRKSASIKEKKIEHQPPTVEEHTDIEMGHTILNDSLYLGTRNGSVYKLIPTGKELPFSSEIQFGFKLMPGQKSIEIPIKSRNIDGSYRTIATGKMKFECSYVNGAFVSFMVNMNSSKLITIKAWTSSDEEGHKIIEEGTTEILVGSNEDKDRTVAEKILARSGDVLNASNEINNIKQLCIQLGREKSSSKRALIMSRLNTSMKVIVNAGNPHDFGEYVLNMITSSKDYNLTGRLFLIAGHMVSNWSEAQRKQLSNICMEQLSGELSGVRGSEFKKYVNIQAIYALGKCGSNEQIKKVSVLNNDRNYRDACLDVHGMTGTDIEWIIDCLKTDATDIKSFKSASIVCSAHAAALGVKNNMTFGNEAANLIMTAITSGNLKSDELSELVLYLGAICDQRVGFKDRVDSITSNQSRDVILGLEDYYDEDITKECCRQRIIAEKLINGESLLSSEEEFLKGRLEK